MATYQKITSLLFKPQGVHDSAVDYSVMDVVASPDKSRVYFAVQNVPAGIALTNEEYWQLQIDLSSSKSAMDEALASFGSYAKEIGMRVKGETAKASGNPVTCLADAGSLLQPVTVLEPQQEGSGDPYPAGGGKNLIPPEQVKLFSNDAYVFFDNPITLKAGHTYTFSLNHVANGIYFVKGGYDASSNENIYAFLYDKASLSYTPHEDCDAWLLAIFNDGTPANLEMQLEIGPAATEYAPPSNIRPFIGYDKLDLHAAGKNLLSLKNLTNTVVNNVNAVIYDNEIDLSPKAGGVGFQQWYGKMTIPESWRGKTFTYSVQSSVNGSSASAQPKSFLIENDANGNEIGIAANLTVTPGVASSGSFVVKENTVSFTILFRADQNQMFPTGAHMWFGQIQLEESPVMTAYMPYQGKLHTVQIGETVYGGKLDWLMGKLVAEWAMVALTGEERHAALPDNSGKCNRFRVDLPETLTNSTEMRCSHFKQTAGDKWAYTSEDVDEYFGECAITSGYIRVLLPAKTESEAQAFFAAQKAAGTPVQFVWKLATPIEIQLPVTIISAADPEQANTLYGDGRIDVEYVKPLHVSIEERVAAAVAAAMNTEGA